MGVSPVLLSRVNGKSYPKGGFLNHYHWPVLSVRTSTETTMDVKLLQKILVWS